MRKRTAILILFLSVVTGNVFAQSHEPVSSAPKITQSPQLYPQKGKPTVNQEQRGSEQIPLVVRVAPTQKTETEIREEARDREEKSTNERWMVGSTIVVAIFTCLLALFTWRLWRSTEKLVKGAEDTAERQLRAYISVAPTTIRSNSVQSVAEVRFIIENNGQTPAYDVEIICCVDSLPYPLPAEYPFPDLPIPVRKSKIAIGPAKKVVSSFVFNPGLPSKSIEEIKEGTKYRLYAFGRLTYKDAFNKIRESVFLACVGGKTFSDALFSSSLKGEAKVDWEYPDQHNGAT